ncbi:cysG [Symbiodinium natans]|uniref:CysG protein n=1 Tax=Symbiodinium natans TaxID=878477 RepID=A0A812LMM3_9DINO|nr:cysG [Symbiodinium natans]
MIFGRAGEEMEELAAAGVPYEVVPAVTACLAAGADARIPLTFRNCATSLRVHTMNPSTIKDERFDWSQFGAPSATFALYMGLNVVESVTQKMMAAGVSGAMPMALVDRASLPEMQVVTGTVATLAAAVRDRKDLPGPALILMGEVVGLRDRVAGSLPPPSSPTQPALAPILSKLPTLGLLLRQLVKPTASC